MFKNIFLMSSLVAMLVSSLAKGEDIFILGIFDRSGGTGRAGTGFSNGVADYFKYINEKKNGISKRKINFSMNDYGYSIPTAFEIYNKFMKQNNKPVAIVGWGTGDTTALSPKITADKIPYLSASYADLLADGKKNPYNFFVGTSYNDQMKICIRYIASQSAGKKGPIAFVFPDNGFGRGPIDTGKAAAKEAGFEILEDQIVPLEEPNPTQQVKYLISHDVKWVIVNTIGSAAETFIKTARSLGYKGKIIGTTWTYDENIPERLGILAEGSFAVSAFSSWDNTQLRGVKLVHTAHNIASKDNGKMPIMYIQGMATAMVIEKAIELASKNLTGENLKLTLESLKDFDIGGLAPKVTFTSLKHNGTVGGRVYEVKHGQYVPVAEYL